MTSGCTASRCRTHPQALKSFTLNSDGTFTYVPADGTVSDSFSYCANNTTSVCATVTLSQCSGSCMGGKPAANDDAYVSNVASFFHEGAPGVLANDKDPQGHDLLAGAATNVSGGTVTLNSDGSFTAVPAAPPVANGTATVSLPIHGSQLPEDLELLCQCDCDVQWRQRVEGQRGRCTQRSARRHYSGDHGLPLDH